jgi:hypothetical protein
MSLWWSGVERKPVEERDVRDAFWRNEDGSWICIDPVTLDHPKGRVQVASGMTLLPGHLYMGIDLARWLDEQLAKHRTSG